MISRWMRLAHSWIARVQSATLRRRTPVSLGERGEKSAERFLRRKGYRIVARRMRDGKGELDLIAVDGRTVVFVEVKSRMSHRQGHPAEAVDEAKQRQIVWLAQRYRKRHRLLDHAVRFDIVAVTWPENARRPQLEHFINAFESPAED